MCKYVNAGGGVNCNLTLFVEIKARLHSATQWHYGGEPFCVLPNR